MNKMIGIVKYYIENRRTSRGIIVVVPLDETKTVSKLEIGKASLKRGEDVFDGDIVSFELERNDNDCLVNNVTKAVHDEKFLDIVQEGSFQSNYIHIKNFIFNYDSYAYQNFKKAVSSLVSDEMAEKEVVVWPELNPKKVETLIPKRYAGSDNHQGTYNSDKKLFEGVNAEKWFKIRYFPYIPKEVLRNTRSTWEDLDEKTVTSFLVQRLQTATKIDSTDLEWIKKYLKRIIEAIIGNNISTQNKRFMLNSLIDRLPVYVIENEKSLWKFLPENKLETIVKGHVDNQRILWDFDRLFLLNHRELFEQIPVEVIEKIPQMWDDLSERQVFELVKYHLNNNLTKHWEWDKGWIEKYPGLWGSLSTTKIIEIITGSDIRTQNKGFMVYYLFNRLPVSVIENEKSLWKFLPENKLETIVRGHVKNQRILWDLDRLFLLKHRELFEQIPVEVIEKIPQMWDDLSERQILELVRYHLNNNLTKHWEWDKEWILKYPGLLELKREYLALIDEEFLNRIDREDLTIKYWQLCYEHAIKKDKANKEIIKQEIKKRGVHHLYHFTRASNLESILNYGILPRTTLDNNSIKYEYNDAGRHDRCKNAVCTSIEFPNYRMFYKARMSNPNTDWVVIELDAKILYESDCAFCWMNAGDSRISSVKIEERKTYTAFKELFENRAGFQERDSHLNDSDPTNPQAEVLVFSNIPVDYITNIYFCDKDTGYKYINHVDSLSKMAEKEMVRVGGYLFKYRVDYENWQ